jgi:curved DNA-binding protein CbpA
MSEAVDPALELEVLELETKLGSADLFTLLGVSKGADEAEVKAAFYKFSRRLHPDRHFRKPLGTLRPKLLKVFRALSKAHQTLTHPELREAYLTANPQLRKPGPPKVVATKHNKRFSMSAADVAAALSAPPAGPPKGEK